MSKRKPRAPTRRRTTSARIAIDTAFQRLQQRDKPHAACEQFNMALRAGRVRLWADDAEVNPSFFATHLHVVLKATPEGWTAEMAMTRAVTRPRKWAVSAADIEKLPGSKSELPRRKPGPPTKHNWHGIAGEIARRCIDPKTKLLRIPDNESKLASEVLQWCGTKFGREPAESEMREAVRHICAALRPI